MRAVNDELFQIPSAPCHLSLNESKFFLRQSITIGRFKTALFFIKLGKSSVQHSERCTVLVVKLSENAFAPVYGTHRHTSVMQQPWNPVPYTVPSSEEKAEPAESAHQVPSLPQSVQYQIRPAAVVCITGLSMLLTSTVSIALTYIWQTKWRHLRRLPFISEAHYDQYQALIFTTMTVLSATLSFATSLLAFVVSNDPSLKYSSTMNRDSPLVQQLSTSKVKQGEERQAASRWHLLSTVELSPNMHGSLCRLALFCGTLGSICITFSATISIKFPAHSVVSYFAFSLSCFWSILINITTHIPVSSWGTLDTISIPCAWVCSAVMAFSVIVSIAMPDKTTSLIVIFEYIYVGAIVLFLFILAIRMNSCRLTVYKICPNTTSLTPMTL